MRRLLISNQFAASCLAPTRSEQRNPLGEAGHLAWQNGLLRCLALVTIAPTKGQYAQLGPRKGFAMDSGAQSRPLQFPSSPLFAGSTRHRCSHDLGANTSGLSPKGTPQQPAAEAQDGQTTCVTQRSMKSGLRAVNRVLSNVLSDARRHLSRRLSSAHGKAMTKTNSTLNVTRSTAPLPTCGTVT